MYAIRTPGLRLGLGVALLAAAACTSGTVSPSGSAIQPTSVRVTVGPVPMQAQAHWSPGGFVRYQVDGTATFRDTGTTGGRITEIHLSLVTIAGHVETRTIPVDLALPPGGSVTEPLAEILDLSRDMAPSQLRVSATIRSATGSNAFSANAPDIPVTVTIATDGIGFPDAIFAGAGDIAVCNWAPSEATARLLDGIRGTVFTAGDNTYPVGTTESFTQCYNPTWGRHRSRTRPSPGNHDYDVPGAAPYFSYFGAAAGPHGLGYYSYDVGGWHILSLNSNVPSHAGSAQYEWARADLATSNTACSLAYWHHPLFSSGRHGNNTFMRDMWRLLHNAGVEMVLAGHDHNYERFAPQDADGRFDPQGVRGFVVGTGGAELRPFGAVKPNSETRNSQAYGVLRLTLRSRGYDWEFLPVSGQSFTDFGTALCR